MISENESGVNSCCHYSLTEIIEKRDKLTGEVLLYFPKKFLEDYFIDYFIDNDISYKESDLNYYYSVKKSNLISWEILYLLKIESYSAYNWYPYVKKFTYYSEFIRIDKLSDLNFLLKDVIFPKFIKLDTVSSKDTNHSGIFYNKEEVYNIFSKSSRIINTLNTKPISKYHYLFIREPDFDIKKEYRCFIYNLKLTAVSMDEKIKENEKQKLELFINEIITYLPFHSAILDIKLHPEPKLIEINNFGADSPAGAGNFNWKEDYFILYGGMNKVEYKI